MAKEPKVSFGDVLRVREFRALWVAELYSVAGDQLARVALALLVFDRTASAALTALTYALTFLPAVLGGALLSGLADRFPRRRVLIITDLVRAALAAAMAVPAVPLPMLWTLVALLSAAAGPFKAAQLALLPQVLGEKFTTGLSLRQLTGQLAQLVGFAGGGVLLLAIEPHVALLLNAATFLLGAVVVRTGVRARPAASRAVATDEASAAPVPAGRGIWPIFVLVSLVGLYVVPEGIAAPYADELGAAALGVGLLMAADPAGSALGAWMAPRLRLPGSPVAAVVLMATAGIPLVVCLFRPGLVPSVAMWALSGAVSTIFLIQVQAMVVERVPDRRRGAVMGRLATCLHTSTGLAILGGGVAAQAVGPFGAVAAAGLLAVVAAAVVGACWFPARSRRKVVNQPESTARGNPDQRSLLLTKGTSSPGVDCLADPDLSSPGGQEAGPVGDASTPIMNTPGERGAQDRVRPANMWRVAGWRLWTLPARARAFLIGVEAAAVIMTVVLAIRHPVTSKAAVVFAVIVVLGVLAAETTRGVEQMRRRFSDTPHVNMSSVWTLSAALLTTPALAATTSVLLYLHLWWRSWRGITGVHAFRVVFSVSEVILSCYAAYAVDRWLPGGLPPDPTNPAGLLSLLVVIVTYWVANSGLVAIAIALLRSDRSIGRLLGSWSENSLEYATLCVGVLTAIILSWLPWLVVLVLLPLYVLHRSVLVRQLEHAATTDHRTGLLNVASWQSLAAKEFEQAKRHHAEFGVLMIDVDHFKLVNDEFGHLVGDQALRAIADVLRGETRSYDLCGRWGGEEFVILLPGTGLSASMAVANGICTRVRDVRIEDAVTGASFDDLRLSVSIGVATFPDTGRDLQEVQWAADNALFAAKDGGRDRVCVVQPSLADIDRRSANR